MKKIPTLFERDWEGDRSRVLNVVNPAAQWVIDGEGVATIKYDGTAVMVRGGRLFARYDAKKGRPRPPHFEPLGESDEATGHHPGWVPVETREHDSGAMVSINPQYKWHVQALVNTMRLGASVPDGTYEAVGLHFQGNPYVMQEDVLWAHGSEAINVPRTFEELALYFRSDESEGVVWHHPDGRMAKIKRRDFGLLWPVKEVAGV